MTDEELVSDIRAEKRETYGTGRLRTRYGRCHEIAAKAIRHAPAGTVMVQGIDRVSEDHNREHSWLELPDGRTWDPVTCQYDHIRVISVAARYNHHEVTARLRAVGYYGWWAPPVPLYDVPGMLAVAESSPPLS